MTTPTANTSETVSSVPVKTDFPIWRKIKIGTELKTAEDFRRALTDDGYRIGIWGDDILGTPAFNASVTETETDLVAVSVEELGFKDGATRADIYNRATELGLELCPPEVGPQLRLQYRDQPRGEWLLIAMEPIVNSTSDPDVFSLEHRGGGLWLHGYYGFPNGFWDGHHRWVFVKPRK